MQLNAIFAINDFSCKIICAKKVKRFESFLLENRNLSTLILGFFLKL